MADETKLVDYDQFIKEGWKHVGWTWRPICAVCNKEFPTIITENQYPNPNEVSQAGVYQIEPFDVDGDKLATRADQVSVHKVFACNEHRDKLS